MQELLLKTISLVNLSPRKCSNQNARLANSATPELLNSSRTICYDTVFYVGVRQSFPPINR